MAHPPWQCGTLRITEKADLEKLAASDEEVLVINMSLCTHTGHACSFNFFQCGSHAFVGRPYSRNYRMIRSLFEAAYDVTCLTGWSDCLHAAGSGIPQSCSAARSEHSQKSTAKRSIIDQALHRFAT